MPTCSGHPIHGWHSERNTSLSALKLREATGTEEAEDASGASRDQRVPSFRLERLPEDNVLQSRRQVVFYSED